jgi:SAM-dependent methyltransferase
MPGPDLAFWQQRFEQRQTPWARGAASPQLSAWLDELKRAGGPIAVPGCGSGYEVARLAEARCDVIGLDYAPAAVALTREKLAAAQLDATVVEADVFTWQPETPLAAVYEQTFLCALHPDQWVLYAAQLQRWLRPGGRLFALLMQVRRAGADDGLVEGPPYHCDINATRALFPDAHWQWPKPPYARVPHPMGWFELAVVLTKR